jgi:signal transduction histidine kinase
VQTALDPDIVCVVDPGALRQILLNLLDNAVKYGPLGQTVTITLRRVGERARIIVDDQGPGIPAEHRSRIWEPYQRLDSAVAAAVAGSGIGLAVVKQLVALHGGGAWTEAAPGRGARFIVELPVGRARHPGSGDAGSGIRGDQRDPNRARETDSVVAMRLPDPGSPDPGSPSPLPGPSR